VNDAMCTVNVLAHCSILCAVTGSCVLYLVCFVLCVLCEDCGLDIRTVCYVLCVHGVYCVCFVLCVLCTLCFGCVVICTM
jgi:hypothetical protein